MALRVDFYDKPAIVYIFYDRDIVGGMTESNLHAIVG